MKGLLLVDLENDFFPGGALAVKEGDLIIPVINAIVHYPFDLIVATKDWHPPDHCSFVSNHEGKKIGDVIRLGGLDQILWPVHCEQGGWGAEFVPGWDSSTVDKIFYKGGDPLIDSYSAFFDNGHRQSTHLENYLKDQGVNDLFIAGLATDYCVKFTALDAISLGFRCYLIIDACKGVDLHPDDSHQAIEEMRKAGVIIISSEQLKKISEDW